MKHSAAFECICQDAKRRIREITVEEVKAKLEAGEPFHFIDVREDHEWQAGHAAGARHLGRGIIDATSKSRRPTMTPRSSLLRRRFPLGSGGG